MFNSFYDDGKQTMIVIQRKRRQNARSTSFEAWIRICDLRMVKAEIYIKIIYS